LNLLIKIAICVRMFLRIVTRHKSCATCRSLNNQMVCVLTGKLARVKNCCIWYEWDSYR
jgi:hypothetical protein